MHGTRWIRSIVTAAALGRILAILGGIIEDRKGSPLLSAGGADGKDAAAGKPFVYVAVEHFSEPVLRRGGRMSCSQYVRIAGRRRRSRTGQGDFGAVSERRRQKGYDCIWWQDIRTKQGWLGAGMPQRWWVGLRNNFLQIAPDGTVQVWECKNGQRVMIEESRNEKG